MPTPSREEKKIINVEDGIKFNRDYKKLIDSFMRLYREAGVVDLNVVSVSIPQRWFDKYPNLEKDMEKLGLRDRLLGINIVN